MLVLTRRVGQTIIIGDKEITVTFLGLNRGQAVIGIDAPKSVSVHREEVYKRICKERNMKEFKGTKGSWVIKSGENGHSIVCGNHVVTNGGCGCCEDWDESIEVEADAHLISAAPEMFEALQAFIDWCESQEFSYETISSENAYVNAKSLALAAVSKALGEQQQTKEG